MTRGSIHDRTTGSHGCQDVLRVSVDFCDGESGGEVVVYGPIEPDISSCFKRDGLLKFDFEDPGSCKSLFLSLSSESSLLSRDQYHPKAEVRII